MANYKLSVKAEQDIAEIYEYGILNFGRDLATRYIMGLQTKFEFISDNPNLTLSADDILPGLKRTYYRSHVIFHISINNEILIVRILRQEMDFERHLT